MQQAAVREHRPTAEELDLLARLRAGDERAFEALVDRHYAHDARRRARTTCSTRAVAEEVVQEAWLGVLKGLDRFEGRSSLTTWIMRIVVNIAKTRGDARGAQRSVLPRSRPRARRPRSTPERFRGPGDALPRSLAGLPGGLAVAAGGRARSGARRSQVVMTAIEELPPAQRTVITMRDVAGLQRRRRSATLLEVSDGNQRVLLHRARSQRARRARKAPRWLSRTST